MKKLVMIAVAGWLAGQASALVEEVDTLIGVRGPGSCMVGPCLPHASVYPSPDTLFPCTPPTDGAKPRPFPPPSGMWWGDPAVGFSQLHTQGTGGTPSYGLFLVTPWAETFDDLGEAAHAAPLEIETAKPHRFRARSARGVVCEIAPARHGAVYRFTYPQGAPRGVIVNAARKIGAAKASADAVAEWSDDGRTLTGGGTYSGNWVPGAYRCWFAAAFDTPLTERFARGAVAGGRAAGETLTLRIAVSFKSVEQARRYLADELAPRSFEQVARDAEAVWDRALACVEVEGMDADARRRFYSHLFYALVQPRDRTGDFAGKTGAVWDDQYTVWDTWKTLYPLLTLVRPDVTADVVNSFAERLRADGECSVAYCMGIDYRCGQGGDDIDNVIADAFVKGVPRIDWAGARAVLRHHAARRTRDYRERGWVAADRPQPDGYCWRMKPVSGTLGFAYNDWCAATVLRGLGDTDEAARLSARAENWRNVWNADAVDAASGMRGFVQGRRADGTWTGVEPRKGYNTDNYEATNWEMSFAVPHAIEELVARAGGREAFARRLEYAFDHGLIDYGNEPSFLTTWLFNWAGRPDLTSKWAARLRATFPADGTPGDDDSGAMGSLWVFLNAGFMPVAGQDIYALHGPSAAKFVFHLPASGKTFTVVGHNAGGGNIYVKSVKLNGQPLARPFIRHADILAGGVLEFEMCARPPVTVAFSPEGQLTALTCGGVEFAAEDGGTDGGLFLVRLRDEAHNDYTFRADDFAQKSLRCEDGGWRIRYAGARGVPAALARLTVEATVAPTAAGTVKWDVAVDTGTPFAKVEYIDYPRVRMKPHDDGKAILPCGEGMLVGEQELAAGGGEGLPWPSGLLDYPMAGSSALYPGPIIAQFVAFYTAKAGVMFICKDPANGLKGIDARGDGKGAIRLMMQRFTGGKGTPGHAVETVGFAGDWHDAAAIYRDWMEREDRQLPKKLTPETITPWIAESPVTLIYPVRGAGFDNGSLDFNEYYPYTNALAMVRDYRAAFATPILALVMHWEGSAPWAPPYVWPPQGGERMLAEFVERMHEEGNLVGLYASGISWTQVSMIDPRYDRREEFKRLGVAKEIVRGPRGQAQGGNCGSSIYNQRIGYDLCPARTFTREVLTKEIAAAAAANIDYMQYFDQNCGGYSMPCYAEEHGHPYIPGAWQTEAMREVYRCAVKAAGGRMVIGCENGVAGPYAEFCRFNDLRWHWSFMSRCGVPVPLYAFLFHEYTSGFSGNLVNLSDWVDVAKTPFLLNWVMAWNFVNGNLLSLTMKDKGEAHWCWVKSWNDAPPEQAPLRTLVANLTWWRKNAAKDWLVFGRMEKPLKVACAARTIHRVNRPASTVPAVETAAWRHDARRMQILANYGKADAEVSLTLPAAAVLKLRGQPDRPLPSGAATFTVPALDAAMLVLE